MKKVLVGALFAWMLPVAAYAGSADTFEPSWTKDSGSVSASGGDHDHDDDKDGKKKKPKGGHPPKDASGC